MVEAIMIVPTFAVLFASTVFIYRSYNAHVDLATTTRADAWNSATEGCNPAGRLGSRVSQRSAGFGGMSTLLETAVRWLSVSVPRLSFFPWPEMRLGLMAAEDNAEVRAPELIDDDTTRRIAFSIIAPCNEELPARTPSVSDGIFRAWAGGGELNPYEGALAQPGTFSLPNGGGGNGGNDPGGQGGNGSGGQGSGSGGNADTPPNPGSSGGQSNPGNTGPDTPQDPNLPDGDLPGDLPGGQDLPGTGGSNAPSGAQTPDAGTPHAPDTSTGGNADLPSADLPFGDLPGTGLP